ncbi:SHREC complex subunit Mit1 [Schizosaccharomyces japonicus yFS275]|uniref:SHREC complex subunit Mit1 n=1 Tax=Schizosaccharomyces japonicus (strain yFS275 / FY16936) TaxID=402676 RepID=B6K5K7_SCHJY|nr:SHREC complex subunit Mit1 [Schizosaccharomyces japonicus yFS275]EEB08811.1 SHREC complex subunit Mit1 [Schizosaccharomyces japonicus yFS275]
MPRAAQIFRSVVIPKRRLGWGSVPYNPDESRILECLSEDDNGYVRVKFAANFELRIPKDHLKLYKNGKNAYEEFLERKTYETKEESDYSVSSSSSDAFIESPSSDSDAIVVTRRSRRLKRLRKVSGIDSSSSSDENDRILTRLQKRKRNVVEKSRYSTLQPTKDELVSSETSEFASATSGSEDDSVDLSNPVHRMQPKHDSFYHVQLCAKCHRLERPSSAARCFLFCSHCTNAYHVECSSFTRMNKAQKKKTLEDGFLCNPCTRESNYRLTRNCFKCGCTADTSTNKPEKAVDYSQRMFRCWRCLRIQHFQHIISGDPGNEPKQAVENHLNMKVCNDCLNHPKDVAEVVAWRQLPKNQIYPGFIVDDNCTSINVSDWTKEYLVRFDNEPYLNCCWMSSTWLAGVAFTRKTNYDSRMNAAVKDEREAIPEAYTLIDLVLDARYEGDINRFQMNFKNKQEELSALSKVQKVFVKWQELPYSMSMWIDVPTSTDEKRWTLFRDAFHKYVSRFHQDKPTKSVSRGLIPFTHMELTRQPDYIVGGDLMPYQLDGVNWLYYKWYSNHPTILADEMGLGKTVQIISFLSVLRHEQKSFPFLVIVPHATVLNWQREFEKWAPSITVSSLVGISENRRVVRDYVVTTKDDPRELKVQALIVSASNVSDEFSFLKRFRWSCLVVDEGQRLKNDMSILPSLLLSLQVDYKVILTGTPLQNNIRELFNLLHFLDPKKINPEELTRQYEDLDAEKVEEVHQLLKPYVLRRVKDDVLNSLPPKVELIIPLSMTSLQKKLYKSILAKNVNLIKSITSKSRSGKGPSQSSQTSLNNILMQLRKTLAHPYIYSQDVEDRTLSAELSIRSMEEASAKMLLLRILVPKLIEKNHRILFFSQFIMQLDILEDWFDAKNIKYARFDGTTSESDRQNAIDAFCRKDSDLTCFLLSTRAGGVGINLAKADTVIILDPDFNPHQDMQAIARAHRFGQKNNVTVFQLMIRNSVEEKIVQVARRKLLLDHLIVETMDKDDGDKVDLESIIKYGARELFDDDGLHEIKYDEASVTALIEQTEASFKQSSVTSDPQKHENQFAYTRVWEAGTQTTQDFADTTDSRNTSAQGDDDVWAIILKEREAAAAVSAEPTVEGRRRTRRKVSYTEPEQFSNSSDDEDYIAEPTPFAASSDSDSDLVEDEPLSLQVTNSTKLRNLMSDQPTLPFRIRERLTARISEVDDNNTGETVKPTEYQVKPSVELSDELIELPADSPAYSNKVFEPEHRLVLNDVSELLLFKHLDSYRVPDGPRCRFCDINHVPGNCGLSTVPLEICFLCGTPHFSGKAACPLFKSEETLLMLKNMLKKSVESDVLKRRALGRLDSIIKAVRKSVNT